MVAQEAARIIINHGMRDYRLAKQKAADRLGVNTRGFLPGNAEIETAVAEHLQIFGGDSHQHHLRFMRVTALAAMELLTTFAPRLVGPVLAGTADMYSVINLHVFADSPEAVAMQLDEMGLQYRPFERRLRSRRDQLCTYAGFAFHHNDSSIEATVFPVDGIRQAPMSPIDGKPMQRADSNGVQKLLER